MSYVVFVVGALGIAKAEKVALNPIHGNCTLAINGAMTKAMNVISEKKSAFLPMRRPSSNWRKKRSPRYASGRPHSRRKARGPTSLPA
jgi:hypothetical protein